MTDKKNVLVTGASAGLGTALSLLAARTGYKVWATMRTPEKDSVLTNAKADEGLDLALLPMDVANTQSVKNAVASVIAEDGKIDVLINNAGVGYARSTEQASEDDIDWVIDTNLLGTIRTTKAVIPHMRKARSGHVVNISSVGGLVGQPFSEIYSASKFGVEGFTEALACYVQPAFGIKMTVVEPGGIKSEFAERAMKQIEESGGLLEDEYLPLLQRYIGGAQARGDTAYQTSEEVAQVILDCMAQDDPPIRIRTSQWAEDLCSLKTQADPDGKKLQQQVIHQFLGGLK